MGCAQAKEAAQDVQANLRKSFTTKKSPVSSEPSPQKEDVVVVVVQKKSVDDVSSPPPTRKPSVGTVSPQVRKSSSAASAALATTPGTEDDTPVKKGVKFAEEVNDDTESTQNNSDFKKRGTWRLSSKKSTNSMKSVNYEGDKAEDTKDAETRTQLALKAKRRGDVFVEHIEQKERYSLAVVEKSDESRAIIEEALADNILFADLGDAELTLMVSTMKSKNVAKAETLIKQGENGDNFYIVESGLFNFIVDGKKVGSCTKGQSFGELALLYNAPRAATVTCENDGLVWLLPRANFRKIISSTVSRSRVETAKALSSVPLLAELTESQIDALVDCVQSVQFQMGDTVLRKGDKGRILYFIKSGTVECTKIGSSEDACLTLGYGDYFGERALMTSEPRAANVIATSDLECIALDKDDFESHLGPLLDRLDKNLGARVLKTMELFKNLSDAERSKLVEEFKEERFKDGDCVVKQGETGTKFYLIRDGQFEVAKRVGDSEERAHLAMLSNGDFFGEGALLKDEPRGADVVARGPGRVFSLERDAFDQSMQKLKTHLSQHLSMRLDATDDTIRAKKRQQYENILLTELDIMKTLGTGTFGRVKLVHHPKLKKAFALKCLQKSAVVAYRQQQNVLSEKNIMEQADHPFILRLHKTFKDRDCLYMLLEFVQGGELFTLLHIRGGKLGDKEARFYAACVQDALEYLHDREIVYRDLKPENLLIDDVGYIRVVDFGFSKKITTRSFTLCGTPEYLAPELVLGKGHNKAVDIWALGILIYEMIAGVSPFQDPINGDHMVICKKIVRNKVEYPRRFGEKAKDLVGKLLVREPHLRIGCLAGGHQDIKEHPWMKPMDFNELVRKRIKAPWVPEIKDYLDTSAFEVFEEDDNIEPYLGDTVWSDEF